MYSRWEKVAETTERLRYEWRAGDDTDPAVAAVADRHSRGAPNACEWDAYLTVDGDRAYTFGARDAPTGMTPPPTRRKSDVVAFMSWWVQTHPRPLGVVRAHAAPGTDDADADADTDPAVSSVEP